MKQYLIQKLIYADSVAEADEQISGGVTLSVVLNDSIDENNYMGFRLEECNNKKNDKNKTR